MIQVTYRVKAEQITGGPGWLDTDRFDMEARVIHRVSLNVLWSTSRL
jgi:uncharacterized protein (TIGR03435 family)